MYEWSFGVLWTYRWLFLSGVGVTVAFTIALVVLGLLIGLIAALVMLSPYKPLRALVAGYIELFRCTPALVQLIWFFYALPILAGVEISAVTASILALSLYGGSFYAEIIRGGIVSIEAGQSEAALALGMTPSQRMRRIILPQAFKRMLPPLMNQSILQLKNTSLVSMVAVPDLLYRGQMAANDSYRFLEIYTLVAALYFIVLYPLTLIVRRLERKLSTGD